MTSGRMHGIMILSNKRVFYEITNSEGRSVSMEMKLSLPIGIEDFKEVRKDGYYYVDKTALIQQVLEKRSKVTLFTRPRRFGKSLNMSMLKNFFEIGTDAALFEGLHISKNTQMCEKYMGKYPVIAVSLKGVDAATYEEAFSALVDIINQIASQVQFLMDSTKHVFRDYLMKI